MEKYGFVYLWYDRKHKRYYIGCRWGDENDGYICSSTWMKQGYKHRPEDFKRRILSRVYTHKKDLLQEEFRWLNQIKDSELGKRYYNLQNHHFGHWSSTEYSNNIISKLKGRKHSEETRRKISEAQIGKKRVFTEEHKKKLSESRKGIVFSEEHKKKLSEKRLGVPLTNEAKQKMKISLTGRIFSEETKRKIGNAHKGKLVSEETKKKLKDSHKGQIPWNKGKTGYKKQTSPIKVVFSKYYNNGINHPYTKENKNGIYVKPGR